MVEKLGHKKRLQTMRREWIDEGKPRRTTVEEADVVLDEDPSMDKQDHEGPDSMTSGTVNDERPCTPSPAQDADDDLYSATPQAVQDQRRREREAGFVPPKEREREGEGEGKKKRKKRKVEEGEGEKEKKKKKKRKRVEGSEMGGSVVET